MPDLPPRINYLELPQFVVPRVEFLEPSEIFDVFQRPAVPEYAQPLIPLDPHDPSANTILGLRERMDLGNINFGVIPLHLASKLPDPVECERWLRGEVTRIRNEGKLEGRADINGGAFNIKMTHPPTDEQLDKGLQLLIFREYDEFPDARRVQLYLEINDEILISPGF